MLYKVLFIFIIFVTHTQVYFLKQPKRPLMLSNYKKLTSKYKINRGHQLTIAHTII